MRGDRLRVRALRVALLVLLGPAVVQAQPDPAPEAAARYRHAVHDAIGVPLTCTVCHATTVDGQPTFPGADDHRPCANAGCHANDFAAREPSLCFVCHAQNTPFTPNPVQRALDGDEFKAVFSHALHLGSAQRQLLGRGCALCHVEEAGGPALAPTPDTPAPRHAQCVGCHQQLVRPAMNECGACHALALGSPTAAPADSDWRVAAGFSHASHRLDPRLATERAGVGGAGWNRFDRATAAPLECDACHALMAEAKATDGIVRPAKDDCAGCHEGTYAFKVSGFGCARCHAPASAL